MFSYDTTLGWQCYSYPFFFLQSPEKLGGTPHVPALPSLPH
jgi:hypothetical protein